MWLCSCLCGFYFCPGMRRGMEEMWAVFWGCVDVIWAVWLCSWFMWTIPLFAGGLAFYEAVLAFSAANFCVVVEVVLWAVGSVGRKVGMVWFSGGVFVFFGGF